MLTHDRTDNQCSFSDFPNKNSFERSDEQIRQTIGNVTGGLGVCLWLGLTGALCASIGLIAAIMSGASETRLHGSLIKKEAYQMESETY